MQREGNAGSEVDANYTAVARIRTIIVLVAKQAGWGNCGQTENRRWEGSSIVLRSATTEE